MKVSILVHKAAEGGYWTDVPSIPECESQGETMDEQKANMVEAIQGCLAANNVPMRMSETDQALEIAL